MIIPLEQQEYEDDDVYYLIYDPIRNIFEYDGGFINYTIWDIMTPNEVRIFKALKEDIVVKTKSGDFYIVIYDSPEDSWDAVEDVINNANYKHLERRLS
jgi:hypothetical protein